MVALEPLGHFESRRVRFGGAEKNLIFGIGLIEDRGLRGFKSAMRQFDRQDRRDGRLFAKRRAPRLDTRLKQGANAGDGQNGGGGGKPGRAEI